MTVNAAQFAREGEAFTQWTPQVAAIVARLAKRLPGSLVGSEGQPSASKALREQLQRIPSQELAGRVVHATLNEMLGWLREEDRGPGPVNTSVLQDVARHVGGQAFRAYLMADAPAPVDPAQLEELGLALKKKERGFAEAGSSAQSKEAEKHGGNEGMKN